MLHWSERIEVPYVFLCNLSTTGVGISLSVLERGNEATQKQGRAFLTNRTHSMSHKCASSCYRSFCLLDCRLQSLPTA